jgi:hypothetical protein
MLDICMETVIPVLQENAYMGTILKDTITEEFRDYLEGQRSDN